MSAHHRLIQNLKQQGILKTARIEEVMKAVDRSNFTRNSPHVDSPQSIGYGVTISAPHMHAIALEALRDQLVPGSSILDVGSGSGYLTACMALLVSPNGKAIGVEHVSDLVNTSVDNCKKDSNISALLDSKVLQFHTTDGRRGFPEHAPYDAIHVGAAADKIPDELIEQLKTGGRIICPVGPDGFNQYLVKIDKKSDGTIETREMMGVRYVPLTDLKKQLEQGSLKTERIEEVMKAVDRSNFTSNNPQVDSPQRIGYGVTISAPHMHAIALEALQDLLVPGSSILDVGSGSGYLTACMALLVSPNGKAIGVDHVNDLVKISIDNCKKDSKISALLDSKVLQFHTADGRKGFPERAPYDAIHVGAASDKIPDELIDQLKVGGRIICPVGPEGFNQYLVKFDKKPDGSMEQREMMGVRYGSLTTLKKQLALI